MVPGMFERERRATEERRVAWLASALPSPVKHPRALAPRSRANPAPNGGAFAFMTGLLQRGLGLAAALAGGRRAKPATSDLPAPHPTR